jgi:hypothetical protein
MNVETLAGVPAKKVDEVAPYLALNCSSDPPIVV